MSLITKEHKLKYQDLWKYKDDQLTLSFCLSEFIDNSISSCEQQIWNSNPNYKLVIDIDFDNQLKRYVISDNAGGMSPKELDAAMLIGNKKNYDYDNSKKNQYGIGMKSAIFWIGKDAIIYSKCSNCDEIYGNYHADMKESNDDVVHDIDKTKTQDRISYKTGTKIIINNVYPNNRTITRDQFEKIDYFLGHRYSKYLSSGNLEINVKVNDVKDSFSKTIQTWDIYRDGVYQLNIDSSKLSRDELENKINNSMDAINGDQALIDDIKNKLINGLPLEFDDFVYISNKYGVEYKTKIKVYVLKEAKGELAGLGVIQSNRYIHHPVLMKKESKLVGGLYKPWHSDRWRDGYWKWIRIDLALEDIPSNEYCNLVKPEKNKKEIIFDSNSNFERSDFNDALCNTFEKWCNLTGIFRELSQTNKNDETIKFENKDARVSYDEENDILSTEEIIFLNNLEQKIKTKIKIIDKPDESWLINLVNHNEDDNLYEYKYNSGNKYFSKIKKESELSYVLKLIIYLDIFYLGKNDDESFAKNIESILNFFQKN